MHTELVGALECVRELACRGKTTTTTTTEAVLDIELRSAEVPRMFIDVIVRHSVPGCPERLARAACRDGSVNQEAEQDKRDRYPDGRTPWRVVPLAMETYGRLGRASLQHLRSLARTHAARLQESGDSTTSALLFRWGCQLSVALHRANVRNLLSCLGSEAKGWVLARQLRDALAR